MSDQFVLRYAPSPTGPQHIGGIRTALYCYFFAKKHGGEFILRIEDTDQGRFVPGAEEYIIEATQWCGLEFTQGPHIGGPHRPYRQSERTALYQEHARKLLDNGKAYMAFDTPEDIQAMQQELESAGVVKPTYNFATRMRMQNSLTLSGEEVQFRLDNGHPYVVRLLVPENEEISFRDEIRDQVVINSSQVDDKVLLKSDGFPTYHLANVVDDHFMGVTHVIRGEEWLPSTPLHVLLYRAFGWEATMPKFAHLPLLLNPNGGKMSKRNAEKLGISTFPLTWTDPANNEVSQGYREMGYLPEAFVNYMALLGWHPGHEEEILSMEQLIDQFSLDRVSHSGAKFDLQKLNHFNGHYIRGKSDAELLALWKPELLKAGITGYSDDFLLQVIPLMKERITFIREIHETAPFFFETPDSYDEKQVKKRWKSPAPELISEMLPRLESLESWDAPAIEQMVKEFMEEKETGLGKIMMPFRLALTGMASGPGTFDIAAVIGMEESLKRLSLALERLGVETPAG